MCACVCACVRVPHTVDDPTVAHVSRVAFKSETEPLRGRNDQDPMEPALVPDAIVAPWGANVTERTADPASWLANKLRSDSQGTSIFHTLIVPSECPETILVPSGEKSTE